MRDWTQKSDLPFLHRSYLTLVLVLLVRWSPPEPGLSSLSGLLCSGHHHEDGTQSDSEDPVLQALSRQAVQIVEDDQPVLVQPAAPTKVLHQPLQDSSSGPDLLLAHRPPRAQSPTTEPSQQDPLEHLSQQAFIIEFFDDNPRKKRSQSFTHNPVLTEPHPALKKVERRRGGERPASVHGQVVPTQQVMVPLKGHSGPQRSSSLKRDKPEPEAASSTSVMRPFGSVGKHSKLTREFAAEVHTAAAQQDTSPSRDRASTPPMSAPPVMVSPPAAAQALLSGPDLRPTSTFQAPGKSCVPYSPAAGSAFSPAGVEPKGSQRGRTEEEDSLSDAGTYTIETEAQDKEVEQARSMIDQVSSQVTIV